MSDLIGALLILGGASSIAAGVNHTPVPPASCCSDVSSTMSAPRLDLIGGPLPAGLYRVKVPSAWPFDAPEPDGRKDFNVAWDAMQLWRYAVCA